GDDRSFGNLRAARLQYGADAAASDDLADLHRRDVALRLRQPGAHGRIDAEPVGAHENLALRRFGNGALCRLEVVARHQPFWPPLEKDLPVHGVTHRARTVTVLATHERTAAGVDGKHPIGVEHGLHASPDLV